MHQLSEKVALSPCVCLTSVMVQVYRSCLVLFTPACCGVCRVVYVDHVAHRTSDDR
jgi:hypothetical protein